MCGIAINISSQQGHFEIDILGATADFANLTKQLTIQAAGVFPLKYKPNTHFPVPMSHLSIEPVGQSKGVITALIEGAEFTLSGDAQAFHTNSLVVPLAVSLEEPSSLWYVREQMPRSITRRELRDDPARVALLTNRVKRLPASVEMESSPIEVITASNKPEKAVICGLVAL